MILNGRKPRVLAITLARGGSKSIPKKNIAEICGKPLLAYTIIEGLKSNKITRYLVSTDDPEIQKVAIEFGAEAPFVRPAELSGADIPSVAPLQHAVGWAEKQEGRRYDFVIELMCTNPLKTVDDIDAVLDKLIETKADSVISVAKLEDHHPARVKKIVDDRIADFCLPEPAGAMRQALRPEAYIRNGSIYAMKRDVLMVLGARFGTANSRPYIMPPERSVNIDGPVELLLAEVLIKRRLHSDKPEK